MGWQTAGYWQSRLRRFVALGDEAFPKQTMLRSKSRSWRCKSSSIAAKSRKEQYVEAEAAILKALHEVQRRKIELAGGDPDAMAGGLTGTVQEGSGATLTWGHHEPE